MVARVTVKKKQAGFVLEGQLQQPTPVQKCEVTVFGLIQFLLTVMMATQYLETDAHQDVQKRSAGVVQVEQPQRQTYELKSEEMENDLMCLLLTETMGTQCRTMVEQIIAKKKQDGHAREEPVLHPTPA